MAAIKSDAEDGWAALFLFAVSPGQIIRYLERQRKAGKVPASTLLVSDAVAPTGLRVLIGDITACEWMDAMGPLASNVFPSAPITLLWQRGNPDSEGARSGFTVWNVGEEIECGDIQAEPKTAKARGVVARLLRSAAAPESAVLVWATQRQLPASRIPALRKRGPTLALVDYDTVSRLDQKSLLVENSPRLYRFLV